MNYCKLMLHTCVLPTYAAGKIGGRVRHSENGIRFTTRSTRVHHQCSVMCQLGSLF